MSGIKLNQSRDGNLNEKADDKNKQFKETFNISTGNATNFQNTKDGFFNKSKLKLNKTQSVGSLTGFKYNNNKSKTAYRVLKKKEISNIDMINNLNNSFNVILNIHYLHFRKQITLWKGNQSMMNLFNLITPLMKIMKTLKTLKSMKITKTTKTTKTLKLIKIITPLRY